MYRYRVSFKEIDGGATIVNFSDQNKIISLETSNDFVFTREKLYSQEELFEQVLKGTENLGELVWVKEVKEETI